MMLSNGWQEVKQESHTSHQKRMDVWLTPALFFSTTTRYLSSFPRLVWCLCVFWCRGSRCRGGTNKLKTLTGLSPALNEGALRAGFVSDGDDEIDEKGFVDFPSDVGTCFALLCFYSSVGRSNMSIAIPAGLG